MNILLPPAKMDGARPVSLAMCGVRWLETRSDVALPVGERKEEAPETGGTRGFFRSFLGGPVVGREDPPQPPIITSKLLLKQGNMGPSQPQRLRTTGFCGTSI